MSVVEALEQADNPVAHADALADVVVELTNAGLDAYFMQPLKLARPGFVVEQSASLGLALAAVSVVQTSVLVAREGSIKVAVPP